ncbi:MAG: hypothetical protein R2729_07590 [Bryobacteraceae bacterium]
MRREPDYFEERPLELVYIAKKLREALAVEELLTANEIDYLVEVDYYTGGLIFRSERAGAFLYVEESKLEPTAELLRSKGYRPQPDHEK